MHIKPLEWTTTPPPGERFSSVCQHAAGIGGHYTISIVPDGGAHLWFADDPARGEPFAGVAEAQAAAQADHEERVRALLVAA